MFNTLPEADVYLDLYEKWVALDNTKKTNLIRLANRLLRADERLAIPEELTDDDTNLKHAELELAYSLLDENFLNRLELINKGVKRFKVGNFEEDLVSSIEGKDTWCKSKYNTITESLLTNYKINRKLSVKIEREITGLRYF